MNNISIIIPVYNVAPYLQQCVESAVRQNIKAEIIIVDDGSNDDSGTIANRLAEEFPNITVIHQTNKGLAAARNIGLQAAIGEYLVFLDGDDWLTENLTSELYCIAKANSIDIIAGNTLYCYSDDQIVNPFCQFSEDTISRVMKGEYGLAELMRCNSFFPMATNYMYRREWIVSNHFFFENLVHEDELWTTTLICCAERMMITNIPFYCYRQRNDSIMRTSGAAKRVRALSEICRKLTDFAKSRSENGLIETQTEKWLYVKIIQLYNIMFQLSETVKDSTFDLPDDDLSLMSRLYENLYGEMQKLCAPYYEASQRYVEKYRLYRNSDWFKLKVTPTDNHILILIYNTMWNEPLPVNPEDIPDGCLITTDRRYLSDASAVVFHLPDLYQHLDCDIDKRDGQLWVAWNKECEENLLWDYNCDVKELFDVRMDYRHDADIVTPYYDDMRDFVTPKLIDPKEKIGHVCMFISSPFNRSGRQEYLTELMKYIEIDSFGKFANNKRIENDQGRQTKCETYVRYRFVIAFENALSPDYVTEKFYDPLLSGAVPVYMGAPNIESFAPGDNCFVDVRNYLSPKELAQHLKVCLADDFEYMRYHQWRKTPFRKDFADKVKTQELRPFVRLCNLLKQRGETINPAKTDILSSI